MPEPTSNPVTVTVKPNGPLRVAGPITLVDPTGKTVALTPGKPVALCRCGHSTMKPYCDASHKQAGLFRPLKVELTENKRVAWCGCKHTKTPPYCDGTHQKL